MVSVICQQEPHHQTFLMAYSKAKLKSNGNNAAFVLDDFGQENYQANVYLYTPHYI
jgi:hypothetical protein